MSEQIKAAKAIRESIFETLGQPLRKWNLEIPSNGEWVELSPVAIHPSMCGPVAKMFAEVSCSVHYTVEESVVVLWYEWSYTHSNGRRNGYKHQETISIF